MSASITTTLVFLKPDVFETGYIGGVIDKLERNNFEIVAMKVMRLTRSQAEAFYAVHRGKRFYEDLVVYVTRGKIVPIILSSKEGLKDEDLIRRVRELMGATNPVDATEGTIRAQFGKSLDANVLHGSDSPATAREEMSFFFAGESFI
ncbi:hypothetical protein LCGC14_2012840 [marine sediment metagenome]|uniref:Nucleoside diphosphate kinase-like domain-containing protein n=1 Tax=marine sediment metagenome TaxID=412755 RepID=A0A0F9EZS3_9ZZZZ